jgi:hypothetical protein
MSTALLGADMISHNSQQFKICTNSVNVKVIYNLQKRCKYNTDHGDSLKDRPLPDTYFCSGPS